MLNISSSTSSDNSLKYTATIFTIITVVLAFLTSSFCFIIVIRLIYCGKLKKCYSKNNSRQIGLLHSMNTYIHIIGETTTFLIMSSRTLYGDFYLYKKEETFPSWHCRLLNYLVSMFAAGIYGSCFLQALFRFWRIMKPHQHPYKTFSFHFQLILFHWLSIILLSIPVWFRAIYLSSENFCLNRFSDTWTSIYISITSVAMPISGIVIVYLKIVMYMKHKWQLRKRWRRIERDRSMIKRILLLVIVLSNTSGAAVFLWLLMFIQKRLHPLSYRLLCFIIEIGMLMCSVTLLVVSPQLKRALQATSSYQSQCSDNKSNTEEVIAMESEFDL